MTSLRAKMTLLTVIAILISVVVASLFGGISIRNLGSSDSEQILLLLCETGQKNLNQFFNSVEQSVDSVASYVTEDLKVMKHWALKDHMDRVQEIFLRTATQTNGVKTFYYRIDPTYSDNISGFWYTNLDGNGFVEHEVTDISQYDMNDTTKLVWFTVPKATGKPTWLPPYYTDNLDIQVISYNVPVYQNDRFIGVLGIELDYSVMKEQVDNIKFYDNNGYAFIIDYDGNLVYHPLMDLAVMTEEEIPETPKELLTSSKVVQYTFQNVRRQAAWLPLENGMRLYVTVPVSVINQNWQRLIGQMIGVSAVLLVLFSLASMRFTGHITKPLRELTEAAAEMNKDNYDVELKVQRKDEVGILANSFRQLISHLKVYINDLNSLAYADALTSVRNKGAYDIFSRDLQSHIENPDEHPAFAVCVCDCDDLKKINDQYGHDKGDIYLKAASSLICSIFKHSPVFRTGGDEFTVILQGEDFENRENLLRLFDETSAQILSSPKEKWEKASVTIGLSEYDPEQDPSVEDVARRADHVMYENKRRRKTERRSS